MTIIKSKALFATLLVSAGLLTSAASARTISSVIGRAFKNVDRDCFVDTNWGIKNTCGGNRWFIIPLTWDLAGGHTLKVSGSTNLNCSYLGTNLDGSPATPSSLPVATETPGVPTPASSISVALGSYGRVQCLMPANSEIYGVDQN
jgi:hypothetical protein